VVVTVLARVGEEGKLYGSVGTQEVADALTALGHQVQKSEVRMPEGVIRVAGEHEVDLQFHTEVFATVKVIVAAE
jgi:large subunit ribosomal protein L9